MVDVQLVIVGVVVVSLVACVVMLARRVANTNQTLAGLAKSMADHAFAHDKDQREMKRIKLETDREAIMLNAQLDAKKSSRRQSSPEQDGMYEPDYKATVDIMDN